MTEVPRVASLGKTKVSLVSRILYCFDDCKENFEAIVMLQYNGSQTW